MIPLLPSGGAVLAMIISLKNNARRRKKAYEALKNENKKIHRVNKVPKYKKVSKQKLSLIKRQIVNDIEKENNKYYLKDSIIILLISGIILYGLTSYYKHVREKNIKITKERLEIERKKTDGIIFDPTRLDFFLKDAEKWLTKHNYENAKLQYQAALQIDSTNYAANLGYTSVFVYKCIEKNMDCKMAENLMVRMISNYGNTEQILHLKKLLSENK